MAKRELKCGHKPLRPWERLVAYVVFIMMIGLTFGQAHFEGMGWRLLGYIVALLFAQAAAIFVFIDARVTVHLRRREHAQRLAARQSRVAALPSQPRFRRAAGRIWDFFSDPAPTSGR
jgi:hypothetical protein